MYTSSQLQPDLFDTYSMRAQNLFTFGYEGMDISSFIDRLLQFEVRCVVDVRDLPLSRKPGFSKSGLSARLNEYGITYVHMSALGCPKNIRDRYRVDGDWAAYTRDFNAYLSAQASAVQELTLVARSSTACLICYEADFTMCHRMFVARAAHKKGAPAVVHIAAKTAFPDRQAKTAA